MNIHRKRYLGAVMSLALALAACTSGDQPSTGPTGSSAAGSPGGGGEETGYPEQAVEFLAAGDPGGGLDLFGRAIEEALSSEDMLDTPLQVSNIGGGGGTPAMAVLQERADDAYTLVGNSNRVYLNPIIGTTDISLENDSFVPIAQLMTEYVVIGVRADSEFESAEQLMDALSEDPTAVNFGVGTVPGDDQLNILRAVDAAGIDPSSVNIVAFSAGGDLMTQLLGGQVDVISSGLSETLPQVEAEEVRLLAISAPERLEAVPDVPTWTEQGIDVVVDHWRGVFGPGNMPQEAQDYWVDKFAAMVETETWQEVLDRNGWEAIFNGGDDFRAVLEEEGSVAEELLTEVGLVEG